MSKNKKFRYDINAKNVCTILMTNECNYKCPFCVADDFVIKDGIYLTDDDISSAIPKIKELGGRFITLSGGEPTLNPNIKSICKELYDANFDGVCLITNGSKPSVIQDVSEYLTFVRMSFSVIKSIKEIERVNELANSIQTPIRVQIILTNLENGYNSIEDLKWLREHLNDNVTIAASTLRLANEWCVKHQPDEDYWMKQGSLDITNRYIVTLGDGTTIALRQKSLNITGDDPVEEELVMFYDNHLQYGFNKDLNEKQK